MTDMPLEQKTASTADAQDFVFLGIQKRQWDELARERDELRAENERLLAQVEETAKECGLQKTDNERVRAEVKRLRKAQSGIIDSWFDSDRQTVSERDELRAENERLTRDRDGCEAASLMRFDEIELLGRERDELLGAIEQSWRPEVRALRAENVRLRAALAGHHIVGFGCAISTCQALGRDKDG